MISPSKPQNSCSLSRSSSDSASSTTSSKNQLKSKSRTQRSTTFSGLPCLLLTKSSLSCAKSKPHCKPLRSRYQCNSPRSINNLISSKKQEASWLRGPSMGRCLISGSRDCSLKSQWYTVALRTSALRNRFMLRLLIKGLLSRSFRARTEGCSEGIRPRAGQRRMVITTIILKMIKHGHFLSTIRPSSKSNLIKNKMQYTLTTVIYAYSAMEQI